MLRASHLCALLVGCSGPELVADGVDTGVEIRLRDAGVAPSEHRGRRSTGPFRVFELERRPHHPSHARTVQFSHDVDPATRGLTVTPEVPDLSVDWASRTAVLRGGFAPNTTYTIALPTDLRDRWGQPLEGRGTLVFQVGPDLPDLAAVGGQITVLSPDGDGTWAVRSTGRRSLRVTIHRVQPSDLEAWGDWVATWKQTGAGGPLPGVRLDRSVVRVAGPLDEEVQTRIDLSPWLEDGLGHLIVHVRGASGAWRDAFAWVQGTRLGLHAIVDDTHALVWATDLADGTPASDVALQAEPLGLGPTGRTDAEGLARLELPDRHEVWDRYGPYVLGRAAPIALLATRGRDVAILPVAYGEDWWLDSAKDPEQRTYLIADVPRPGHPLRMAGWVRMEESGPGGGLVLPGVDTLRAYPGPSLALSPTGQFFEHREIPSDGHAGFRAWTVGKSPFSPFFRQGELSIARRSAPPVLGEVLEIDATSSVSTGDLAWTASAEAVAWAPTGRSGWSFGAWRPWWLGVRWGKRRAAYTPLLAGSFDPAGTHAVQLDLSGPGPLWPVEATVRTHTAPMGERETSWTVHPAEVAVGVRTGGAWVRADEAVEVDLLTVDLQGREAAGVEVRVGLRRTRRHGEVDHCRAVSDSQGRARCTFAPGPGAWRVRAEVRDGEGRPSATEVGVWVAGAGDVPAEAELVPLHAHVPPGGLARLLVRTPFHPAEGLLTVRSAGVVSAHRLRLDAASAVVDLPVDAAMAPNATLQIDLQGAGGSWATAVAGLSVPPVGRALSVEVTPEPSSGAPDSAVSIQVRDSDGAPVAGAELIVATMAPDSTPPDPLDVMYARRHAGAVDHRLHELLAPGGALATRQYRTQDSRRTEERNRAWPHAPRTASRPPRVVPAARRHSSFLDVELLVQARTDADGRARVPLSALEAAGERRVVAVAAAGAGHFGSGSAAVSGQAVLEVPPEGPSFVHVGDELWDAPAPELAPIAAEEAGRGSGRLPQASRLLALLAESDIERAQLELDRAEEGGGGYRSPGPLTVLHLQRAHALALARGLGLSVDPREWAMEGQIVTDLEPHLEFVRSEDSMALLRAYALEIRRLRGSPDPDAAHSLLGWKPSARSTGVLGWLLPTLAASGRQRAAQSVVHELEARADELAPEPLGEAEILFMDRHADAIALYGLRAAAPESPAIAKLERSVRARSAGQRRSAVSDLALPELAGAVGGRDLDARPLGEERGLRIERRYRAIEDPEDVTRDPDGTWRIRRGAYVRVELWVESQEVRHHIRVVEPTVAGFAVPHTARPDRGWRGWRPEDTDNVAWRKLDRVEVSAAKIGAGSFSYHYVARASFRGRFRAPPAWVMELYRPEFFGRGEAAVVVIE